MSLTTPRGARRTGTDLLTTGRRNETVLDRFWHGLSETQFAWVMLAPSLILLILLSTAPLLGLVGLSFYRLDFGNPSANRFIGLGNYVRMSADSGFWHATWLTFVYTASTVALQIVLGMALALLFFEYFRGTTPLRIVILLPMILAPVVVGLVWRTLILTPRFGILDYFLSSIGLGSHRWLTDPALAMLSIIVIHTWQWTPFAFLVFLASLNAIPTNVLEAAMLDCRSTWQRQLHVMLPLIRSAIVVVVVLRSIVALAAFAAPYAATGGGPGNATMILNLYTYNVAFANLDVGYGAALASMLLAITVGVSWLFFRLRAAER
ncbi:MAG: sugar ABC transporter permease [Chloroflexi bacterium]|nr:sugar ABC transporter permease [Chloroflexota bacterium]